MYFDIGTEKYVTRTAGPFPLRVTGPTIQTVINDPPKLPNTQLEPDQKAGKMEPLRRAPGVFEPTPSPLLTRPWFLAAQATPILAWLLLLSWRRRQIYLEKHPAVARRIRVQKLTRKTMRTLRQSNTQADPDAFHANVQIILREHLGMAMNRPAEGIGREILEDEALPLSGENLAALERLHERNQLARFAHIQEPVNAPLNFKDLDRVILALK
ncbi:MAG: hypothetical protein HOK62_00525 [Verrucomicrobiales bacterium]|nr:hypothetical protein [Verrucomicrobiales bacterium]